MKRGLWSLIRNPSALFKSRRNIRFHFDMWHGNGNLDRAIDLLDEQNKEDFRKFCKTQVSFCRGNMFICKSKTIINNFYVSICPWLEKCEKVFGFRNLKGYGSQRIYGFLAERFLSYWLQKNYKCKTMPIIFYDIRKDFN